MLVNLDAEILDLKDEPIVESIVREGKSIPDPDGKKVTLKTICMNCLSNLTEADKALTGKEKFELFEFLMRIKDGGEVDLGVDDLALLKKRIGDQFITLFVGRCYNLLEGK